MYFMEIKNRILNKVKKTGGCWLWTGASRGRGYGGIRVGGVTKLAHRVSYEAFVGPIPVDMFVCHKCDTPQCVNPKHLFVGSRSDNMIDALSKGRLKLPEGKKFFRGDERLEYKLSEVDVGEIRRVYKKWSRENNLRSLAKKYCVDHSLIWQIVTGKKRKTGP